MPSSEGMGGHWDLPGQVHSSCTDFPVPQVSHGLSPLHSCDLNLENISGTALGCRERSLMGPAPQHWIVETLGSLSSKCCVFYFFVIVVLKNTSLVKLSIILDKTGAVSQGGRCNFPMGGCSPRATGECSSKAFIHLHILQASPSSSQCPSKGMFWGGPCG